MTKPISEVSQELKNPTTPTETETPTDVLKKEVDDSVAKEEATAKATEVAASTKEALAKAKPVSEVKLPRPNLANDDDRAVTRLKAQLEVLLDANATLDAKRIAHKRLVEVICANAKRNVMDTLLAFYTSNRNNSVLNEYNALQGIDKLDLTTKMQVETLYVTMRTIASGRRGRINLDFMRDVFKNDDLVNWLSLVQSGNYVR